MTADQLEKEIRALSHDDRAELLERFGLIASFDRSGAHAQTRPLPVWMPGSPEKWVTFRVETAEAGQIEGIYYFDPLLIELSKRFQQKAYPATRSGARVNDGPTFVGTGDGSAGFRFVKFSGPMEFGVFHALHTNALNILWDIEKYKRFFLAALERLPDYIENEVLRQFEGLQYAGPNLEPRRLSYSESTKQRRDKFVQRLRDLFKPKRGGSKPKNDLSELSQHYSQTHPKWILAKQIYHKSGKGKGWQETIRESQPDLPMDLIECLAECHSLDDDFSSEPADLALENAARLCGAPPFYYSIRYLKKRKGRQSTSH